MARWFVVMAALCTWYLLESKRVNVTYRNRVHTWAMPTEYSR